MKPRALTFLLIILSCFTSSLSIRGNDGHLQYYEKLFKPDTRVAKQEYVNTLNNIADQDYPEILFLKAGLAYIAWNNHERKTGELIKWCKNHLDNLTQPLTHEYLDSYLVMAQYYLTAFHELESAQKCLVSAYSILSNSSDKGNYRYGIYYFLKGLLCVRMYDHVNAIQFFNQSVKFTGAVPELKEYYFQAHLYLLDAMIFLKYFERSMGIVDKCIRECNGEGRSPSDFFQKKGSLYLMVRDTLNAASSYRNGLRFVQDNSSINASVKALLFYNVGIVSRGRAQLQYFSEALKTATTFENNEWLVYLIMQEISLWHYNHNDFENCLKYAQKSLIAGTIGFTDTDHFKNPGLDQFRPFYGLIETLGIKGNAFIRLNPRWDSDKKAWQYNNLDNSLEAVELAAALTEKYLNHVNEENSGLTITENRKRILNNVSVYAIMAYQQTNDISYAHRAFNASERCKMQFLRIRITQKENMKKAGIPDSIINHIDNLTNQILYYENRIVLAEKTGKEDAKALTSDLTGFYDQRDRLYYDLNEKYQDYKTDFHPDICTVGQVQEYLHDDQALIEYSLVSQEIIIFTITKDRFYVAPLLIDGKFLKEIENLRQLISENPLNSSVNNLDSFCQSSGFLYDYLISPVHDIIKGKRLIIVPHNELSMIPFEVLMPYHSKEAAQNRNFGSLPYLIREFPVSYAYSATFLLETKERVRNRATGIGIFVPDYNQIKTDTVFAALSGASEEARLINRYSKSKLFNGTKANEMEFKAHAPGFNILHIASHTLIDEAHPGLSCLVLNANTEFNEDGYLYAYELSEMELSARLVMLSGCNTGFGKLRLSEGLVSIARSLFYTGVRTVGFTLWNVADQAGSELTGIFYDGLRQHQTLDVAMRNSKMHFIGNSDPVKAHPYFWANYLMVGNTEAISVRKTPLFYKIAALMMLLAVPVLLLIIRRRFRKEA